MKCCDRIGARTTYYTRGRKVSLCSKCLEVMLHAENHSAAPSIPRNVITPMCPDGEMGDVYVAEIKRHAVKLTYGTGV